MLFYSVVQMRVLPGYCHGHDSDVSQHNSKMLSLSQRLKNSLSHTHRQTHTRCWIHTINTFSFSKAQTHKIHLPNPQIPNKHWLIHRRVHMAFSVSHCLLSLFPCAPTSNSSSINSWKKKEALQQHPLPILLPTAKTSQISWGDVFIHIFHSVDSESGRGGQKGREWER